jgi:hypothetical protein
MIYWYPCLDCLDIVWSCFVFDVKEGKKRGGDVGVLAPHRDLYFTNCLTIFKCTCSRLFISVYIISHSNKTIEYFDPGTKEFTCYKSVSPFLQSFFVTPSFNLSNICDLPIWLSFENVENKWKMKPRWDYINRSTKTWYSHTLLNLLNNCQTSAPFHKSKVLYELSLIFNNLTLDSTFLTSQISTFENSWNCSSSGTKLERLWVSSFVYMLHEISLIH